MHFSTSALYRVLHFWHSLRALLSFASRDCNPSCDVSVGTCASPEGCFWEFCCAACLVVGVEILMVVSAGLSNGLSEACPEWENESLLMGMLSSSSRLWVDSGVEKFAGLSEVTVCEDVPVAAMSGLGWLGLLDEPTSK